MIAAVEQKRPQLAEMCRNYHVRRLELFGSAAFPDRFDPRSSDIDFLVEFEASDELNPADQYFGLLESLKALFGRDVDLVTTRSLRNPYFIQSVNASMLDANIILTIGILFYTCRLADTLRVTRR